MIRLVKTVGGNNGTHNSCSHCGNSNFIRSGIAWACNSCGLYYPTELKEAIHTPIQNNIKQLTVLNNCFKNLIQESKNLTKK